tara:strand:+ start:26869 stop:27702 length:834 start_codon:yes stop_codon:yes gene_type:complete
MKLIAELCQNHNGKREILDEMILKASKNADIIKIQTILADSLTYREKFEKYRSFNEEYSRLKKLELKVEDEKYFIDKCRSLSVEPMTTLFSTKQIDRFNRLGYSKLKLSGYSLPAFDYGRLLKHLNFDELFFSTSSLTLDELEKTINNLDSLGVKFTMLHCTCIYPTPLESAFLQNIDFYRTYFELDEIGFSDHSNPYIDGLLVPKLAIFSGISVLERHFTILDKDDTRDGKVSINEKMAEELKNFSKLPIKEQYLNLNKFNNIQEFNHEYYRGRFQ